MSILELIKVIVTESVISRKMKLKIALAFAACFAGTLAAPVDGPKNAAILRYDSAVPGMDGYYFE